MVGKRKKDVPVKCQECYLREDNIIDGLCYECRARCPHCGRKAALLIEVEVIISRKDDWSKIKVCKICVLEW